MIFDLFIDILVKLTNFEPYLYCFVTLLLIGTFGLVRRMM